MNTEQARDLPPDKPAATFYWRAFTDLAAAPAAYLHPNGYAVAYLGDDPTLNVHLHTRAQCDALIKVLTEARELLPAPEGGQE